MSIDNYTDRERELRCAVADLQEENKDLQAKLAQQAAMVEKCIVAMNENADRGERAEAELAVCKADAERYRHVRKHPEMLLHLSNGEFDAAIDAAMKGDQP